MRADRSAGRFLAPTLVFASLLAAPPVAAQAPVKLSLGDALRLSEAGSEEIAIARAGVSRADADVVRAKAERLPQVNASALYQRALASQFAGLTGSQAEGGPGPPPSSCEATFVPDTGQPLEERVQDLETRLGCPPSFLGGLDLSRAGFGSENTYNVGLSVSWSAFAGGRLSAQERSAEAGLEAAELGLASARAQVELDVTSAYFDAQLADQLLEIAESTLAQAEETLRLTTLRVQEGEQAEFDALRARVSRDNQRPAVIRSRTQRDLAYDRLRLLLKLPRDQPLLLTTPLEAVPSSTSPGMERVVRRVPVKQAETRVEMQERQLDIARSQRLPNLQLSSQYARIAFPTNLVPGRADFRDDWTVTASVQVPLFTGGRVRGDVQAARAGLSEAQAQLVQTQEFAFLDTRSALAELDAAHATWQAMEGTIEEAERAYAIAEIRYREGISTQLELNDARLQLGQARANRAQAARDLWVAQARVTLLPQLPIASATGSGGFAGGAGQSGPTSPAGVPGGAPVSLGPDTRR